MFWISRKLQKLVIWYEIISYQWPKASIQFFKSACKVMAKDLVRTRRYIQKFYQMRTQLQAVGLRIQTLRSNQQMADAMRGATRVRDFNWYIF